MSAPEWTRDEQSIDLAKNYLRQGSTIDFFEMMSRQILTNHPPDLAVFCLNLVVQMQEGKEIPFERQFQPKRMDENQYMKDHHVSDFLDRWVLELLERRPESDAERFEFHKNYLLNIVENYTSD
ncbi:hypothetical protein STCU_02595 [Strigomonas culicis]|uniref:Uncharacterized protein n=1 Tax=Strigomonas culicis TaxID=28005 RepID=S9UPQ1_9TRYP|nr:hypothetical protein STCU_02595 [Strigomonas culicis]|eukprot:EPY32882.1 hypothetical protein STCU_02595 [Strigomonas culicis]